MPEAARTDRCYDPRLGAILAVAGAGLFALAVWHMGLGNGGGWDPRIAWALTPAFVAPLAFYLVWSRRIGVGGAIGLTMGLTLVHFVAIAVASAAYKPPVDVSILHMLDNNMAHWAQRQRDYERQVIEAQAGAWRGGLLGGAVGAFGAFALMLLYGRSVRRPSALAAMAATGAALTLWGGVALTRTLPNLMSPAQFALWLFLPWQGLFGVAAAWLLHDPKLSRAA